MHVLLFDNHDSFSWNLSHDLERAGANVVVVRPEELKIEIDKVRSADLLTNYEPSWVLKPTPAQKIMARKKKLAEENQG